MAAPEVDFWFEFASTYSYPAASRVHAAAARAGCRVRLRPFLLGPLFKAQGLETSPFNVYPAKGRYMWRDMKRICAGLGLPFQKPSVFPRNGLLAARIACAAEGAAWLDAFVRRVYAENFAADRDIADPAVLRDCLLGLSPEPERLIAAAGEERVKEKLRRNTAEAAQLGVFGAPTCSVNGELFWGNDRVEAALKAAQAAARPAYEQPSTAGEASPPIERAQAQDLDQVVALWQAVFGYTEARNAPAAVLAAYNQGGCGGLFVARSAGRSRDVAGTIMAGYDGHRGFLYRLAVAPPMRGRGIGRALVEAALQHLRALGCMKVNLQVHADNSGAVAFWHALGFAEEARISFGRGLLLSAHPRTP